MAFDKTCIDLIPLEPLTCADCEAPATHYICIDLGFQTDGLGDRGYCKPCGLEILARWREQLPDAQTEDVTRCAHCGSTEIEDISGEYETGVVAPDGHRERRYENAFRCQKCERDQEYE